MDITRSIIKSQQGDKNAYSEVVSCYADRLVALLYKMLGNIEDARDIAQDTFIRAFLNLKRFDTSRPFEPWLYRIGRNLAYNHMKSAFQRRAKTFNPSENFELDEVEGETKSPSTPAKLER